MLLLGVTSATYYLHFRVCTYNNSSREDGKSRICSTRPGWTGGVRCQWQEAEWGRPISYCNPELDVGMIIRFLYKRIYKSKGSDATLTPASNGCMDAHFCLSRNSSIRAHNRFLHSTQTRNHLPPTSNTPVVVYQNR